MFILRSSHGIALVTGICVHFPRINETPDGEPKHSSEVQKATHISLKSNVMYFMAIG